MTEHLDLTTKIRLRQLRCFVKVARKKSFVLASEELGLTQPAVSRSIKELELILGDTLFDRSARGAQLTERGTAFLDTAEAALLQINQGLQTFFTDADQTNQVRIGALPNVCSQVLPSVIASYKADFPLSKVAVFPGTNARLLEGLRRGETDLVIGRLSSSEDMRGLVFEALFDEPIIFVVRAEHEIEPETASLEDLQRYPLLLPTEGTVIRQEIDRFLAGHGITRPQNLVETTSSDFQRAYLTSSECLAAIPRGVVRADIERGVLKELPLAEGDLKGPVGLTVNPLSAHSGAVREFMQRIRSFRYQ
ncbi:MAG: LysR substrate-binding domain-containing protein [Pseudomonadota bacterium]